MRCLAIVVQWAQVQEDKQSVKKTARANRKNVIVELCGLFGTFYCTGCGHSEALYHLVPLVFENGLVEVGLWAALWTRIHVLRCPCLERQVFEREAKLKRLGAPLKGGGCTLVREAVGGAAEVAWCIFVP